MSARLARFFFLRKLNVWQRTRSGRLALAVGTSRGASPRPTRIHPLRRLTLEGYCEAEWELEGVGRSIAIARSHLRHLSNCREQKQRLGFPSGQGACACSSRRDHDGSICCPGCSHASANGVVSNRAAVNEVMMLLARFIPMRTAMNEVRKAEARGAATGSSLFASTSACQTGFVSISDSPCPNGDGDLQAQWGGCHL